MKINCPNSDLLFKYRAITNCDREQSNDKGYTRLLLTTGELYFAKFNELNDPNEMLYSYSTECPIPVHKNELHKYQYSNMKDGREPNEVIIWVSGKDAAEHVRNKTLHHRGVLCLTEDERSLLMFDYYANGHKGICIGLEWENVLRENGTNAIVPPIKMKYRRTPPEIDVSSGNINQFNRIYDSKWAKYRHEKEWRFSYRPGIYKKRHIVKKIIFGCSTSDEDKKMIKNWVKDNPKISLWQAELEKDKYILNIKSAS